MKLSILDLHGQHDLDLDLQKNAHFFLIFVVFFLIFVIFFSYLRFFLEVATFALNTISKSTCCTTRTRTATTANGSWQPPQQPAAHRFWPTPRIVLQSAPTVIQAEAHSDVRAMGSHIIHRSVTSPVVCVIIHPILMLNIVFTTRDGYTLNTRRDCH